MGELADHVGAAIDRYRAGDLDAFEIDKVVLQYSRAAKELWRFCTLTDVEFAASLIDDGERGIGANRLRHANDDKNALTESAAGGCSR